MRLVAIYGAGGLGCLVHDILCQSDDLCAVAFLDSDPSKHGQTIDNLPVRGGFEQIETLRNTGVHHAIVAIGDSRTRVAIAEQLVQSGLQLVSAIHPLATIAPSAKLGEHLVIGARTTICVHAAIGAHSVLSAGSIIEHDNQLGRGVFLHPAVRLAGGVRIGDFVTFGIGASVIPGCCVGNEAQIEPGAIVIRDVLPSTVVGGAPAQVRPTDGAGFVAEEETPPTISAAPSL